MESATQQVNRLPDGARWWVTEKAGGGGYEALRYDIGAEPLLREIKHRGDVVGYVTRNRYEAEVLNTPRMLILDCDVQDDNGRCTSRALYEALLGSHHGNTSGSELAEELIRRQLVDLCHGRVAGPFAGLRGLGFRLYETHNGLRSICTTHRWNLHDDQDAAILWDFMGAAFTDDAYRRICHDQRLFRARLTPKPWRARAAWYDVGCGRPVVCRFLTTIGGEATLPDFEAMIAEHDAVTGALRPDVDDTPLA